MFLKNMYTYILRSHFCLSTLQDNSTNICDYSSLYKYLYFYFLCIEEVKPSVRISCCSQQVFETQSCLLLHAEYFEVQYRNSYRNVILLFATSVRNSILSIIACRILRSMSLGNDNCIYMYMVCS